MDSQNSSTGQENEGDQQPSELPLLSEKDKSQQSSDHVPLPYPSQQEADTRHTLATEPFQPILQVLADLERDDAKFAFPAARLVGLYRRLWESCVSKHIDGEKLEQRNLALKEAGTHLRKERDGLQVRHDKQLSRLRFFEQALELSRERLISLLDDWNHPFRPNLTGLPAVAREW
ncbi:unnamed protein product [Penicillium salamii]|uniref:Uncharacterized protein n=1 Tax=Penicillium salamii TaxID=1612424 RepID=A0A9W4INS1_9EURO|nr:hypothetical protein CBS147333_10311 [Penicillium roqueforti]CAG7965698.1 unnamed protein product [Penicillium salamii]KAI3187445.1 hypothetical protein CBS147311_10199 [Penicillium roqueforti]KAI3260300.1 hypothetical protein CBS147308_10288 [Penicillium roqueforti]KAI3275237.1 hypothetical protein DTO003C3_10279 [Penicillium roqueforti]